MSLLSDILSKIKQPEPVREVPPGLRSTVTSLQKKDSQKRRMLLLGGILILAIGSGFVTFYLFNAYVAGAKKQQAADSRLLAEIKSRHQAASIETDRQQTEPKGKSQDSGVAAPSSLLLGSSELRKTETQQTAPPVTDISSQTKAGEPEQKKEEPGTTVPKPKADRTKPHKKAAAVPVLKPAQTLSGEKEEKPEIDLSARDRWLYMAQGYEAKRDYPNAISSYKKVIALEPENFRAMNNIASILLILNSEAEAKIYLQKTLWLKTDYVPALINMGIALAGLGESENAERYFARVEALDSGNSYAILNIAILHEKQGRFEKAREYYTRLRQLGDSRGDAGLERLKGKQ